jgi:uncharacterized protein involved in exopolysaccharide biosynthesis
MPAQGGYKATARLQVLREQPRVLFRTVETEGGGDDYLRYQKTQVSLVKSRLVISAALQDENVRRYQMIRK